MRFCVIVTWDWSDRVVLEDLPDSGDWMFWVCSIVEMAPCLSLLDSTVCLSSTWSEWTPDMSCCCPIEMWGYLELCKNIPDYRNPRSRSRTGPNKVVGDYCACLACDSCALAACTEFHISGPSGGFHSLCFMFDFVLVLQKPFQANGGHQWGQRGSSSWPETVAGNGFKLMYPLRISKCHLFWRNLSTKAGRVSTHRGGVYVGTAARALILN